MRASLRERARHENVRILGWLVAAGLVIGAAVTLALRTAGEWAEPGEASAASAPKPAATSAPAKAAPTTAVPAKAAPAKVAAAPTATAPRPAAKATTPANARTAASMSPLRPVPRQGVQPLAHLDERQTYQYNALGRRDPFSPLTGGPFVGEDVGGDAPADIGGIKVVGIVWGSEDRFALCEDGRGNSLVLRQGDKVMNGVVEGLKRDRVIVNLTVDGQSQSVAIPLTRKGENANANR